MPYESELRRFQLKKLGKSLVDWMADRRFLVRFKLPQMILQSVIAQTVQIQGDHLVFLDSEGKPVAMFVMTVVESWSESKL
jgi:hypothetical protein